MSLDIYFFESLRNYFIHKAENIRKKAKEYIYIYEGKKEREIANVTKAYCIILYMIFYNDIIQYYILYIHL